ncbi:DUF2059 domain-containing protein [Paracoccus sp. Z330]|uniref:DUF2059 domain-containing protein n=1 Tax=Paracoccus onchidii TaxID=3017813 RepID=A0ABT4ZHL8_9RHOB|nr:DUF2059 domain-containing protein [Paracoccus onchidii]MDB6178852.1 DUF2059 domain-containing protein [Paracoccus onchidii]
MFRFMAVLAVALAGVLTGPGRSAAVPLTRVEVQSPAQLERIWQDLDMTALMPILHDEALVEAELMQQDMSGRTDSARWLEIVSRIHAPQRLKQHFFVGATQALDTRPRDDDDIERALAFYETELGQRIIGLETAARLAMLDPGAESAARDAFLDAASHGHPRVGQIARLIDDADLVGPNVAGGMNALMAFSRGFAEGDGFDMAMTEQQILSDAWAQEPEIRAQTLGWMEAYLLLAYSPLSDRELEEYIDFAGSPEGRALSSVLFAGFDALFQQTSWNLGFAAAGHLQGRDL